MSTKATIVCENEELLKDICETIGLSGKYKVEAYELPNHCFGAFIKEINCENKVPEYIKEHVSKMSSINSSLKLIQFMADQYSKEKGDPEKHVQEYKSVEEFAKFMKLMIDPIVKQTELGGE